MLYSEVVFIGCACVYFYFFLVHRLDGCNQMNGKSSVIRRTGPISLPAHL